MSPVLGKLYILNLQLCMNGIRERASEFVLVPVLIRALDPHALAILTWLDDRFATVFSFLHP